MTKKLDEMTDEEIRIKARQTVVKEELELLAKSVEHTDMVILTARLLTLTMMVSQYSGVTKDGFKRSIDDLINKHYAN